MKTNKRIVSGILATGLVLFGCNYYNSNQIAEQGESLKDEYVFTDSGVIGKVISSKCPAITALTSCDADGDGDYDVFVGTGDWRLILFKNEIPQKNKK